MLKGRGFGGKERSVQKGRKEKGDPLPFSENPPNPPLAKEDWGDFS
jgi:hypothetical protein